MKRINMGCKKCGGKLEDYKVDERKIYYKCIICGWKSARTNWSSSNFSIK
jgi:uncharacterized Zn finger protein